MQYLALIYGDESRWGGLSPEERESEMGEYMALSQTAVTKGGNELGGVATATTVRIRGDETLVTDGPFVELKESLGGYYASSARNARARASTVPPATRAVPAASRDRRSPSRGRDRLAADRRPLRGARAADPVTGRGAEPRGGGRDGRGADVT